MISLCIDIGNSRVKAALFKGTDLLFVSDQPARDMELIFADNAVNRCIVSMVGADKEGIIRLVSSKVPVKILDHTTSLPFKISYATPQSLGTDRVAAVAGAHHFFPNQNCLVIDVGTCVTYDFLSGENIYQGGAISPGVHMRLKALHQQTEKLPLVAFSEPADFIGNSTASSILSGVFFGMCAEIRESIRLYETRYPDLRVLICGGDSSLFVKHLKSGIFAEVNLTLYGLNKILVFNAS